MRVVSEGAVASSARAAFASLSLRAWKNLRTVFEGPVPPLSPAITRPVMPPAAMATAATMAKTIQPRKAGLRLSFVVSLIITSPGGIRVYKRAAVRSVHERSPSDRHRLLARDEDRRGRTTDRGAVGCLLYTSPSPRDG